jgi:uncharacterized protein YkwD
MKPSHLACLLLALWLPCLPAQEQDVAPAPSTTELDEARALLEEFKTAVESDPKKAQELYDTFLTKSDTVQKGFGRHLESDWTRRKGELFLNNSRDNGGSEKSLSPELKQKITEKRALLAEIRIMKDEGKMKERLKKEGWPALEFLEGLYGRGSFELPPDDESDEQVSARERKTKEDAALLVGKFRQELRYELRLPDVDAPEIELGLARQSSTGPAPVLSMTSDDRRVLEQNQSLAAEIKDEEAEGIQQLNQWRISVGLNALLIDPKLCDAARDHSQDMGKLGFFAHDSPVEGKKTPWQRAKNFGTSAGSENIAINSGAKASNRAWFHSPGHHKNMFAAKRTYVGLGGSSRHWTQMFR